MFGQQNDNQQNSAIPDQVIDAAMAATDAQAATSPSTDTDASWQHPGAPLDQPQSNASAPTDTGSATAYPTDGSATDPVPDTNNLLDIKQQALNQLSPLVNHIDQSPEDKFRTTMMMIQASDDQSLIQTAYEAAQQISDEKVKAQALLDVINEINYFTQHQDS